ncbi:MAG: GlsB/YeaQ/YmgE family stress response membrane protein [Blautia sp.]|nr:GlsB/YeaQ/YmgE family stress response membrane protein [Blautia sp.]
MGLIMSIIVGALAGFLGSRIMNEPSGALKNILLGIAGGFVGGLIFRFLGLKATGTVGTLIMSVVGACACIWLGRMFLH